jgi:hypothetical protein
MCLDRECGPGRLEWGDHWVPIERGCWMRDDYIAIAKTLFRARYGVKRPGLRALCLAGSQTGSEIKVVGWVPRPAGAVIAPQIRICAPSLSGAGANFGLLPVSLAMLEFIYMSASSMSLSWRPALPENPALRERPPRRG